jgi:radical SAM superfamily enzyme YgiQ (UPF0313 family)
MLVCLVNAATAAEFTDVVEYKTEDIRNSSTEPQLGILTLAAVLEGCGCGPTIVDLNRIFYECADGSGASGLGDFAETAASRIAASHADVYGFGSICSAYPLAIRIAKALKQQHPDSTLLFGGPQASVVSVETLAAFPFVDFVLRGEAEESVRVFLEELSGTRRFERVPGLTFRSAGGIQQNVDAPLILDLDALPPPAYHLTGELRGKDRASLELGRGCPFSCSFCSTSRFFRRKFRLHSSERMLRDMHAVEFEFGIRDFDLVHDMFTADRKRVQDFCHALINSGKGYTWSCSARTDCVDEELIELMAAAGCKGMFFGIETGSERMQKIIDKHLDICRAHAIIDVAERAGIRSTVSLITGFPQETSDDLRETVQMFMHSARMPNSSPQLNLLAPLADTPIQIEYKKEMTLGDLCSDMSQQGRRQHPGDLEMIREHPGIFPNFYLLPTPDLDRALLLELREFMLMAELRFRWLLGAADQAGDGILSVFFGWVERRKTLYPGLAGSNLRQYYRTPKFGRDFVDSLRGQRVAADELVKAFMEYEDVVAAASCPDFSLISGMRRGKGEPLDWSDIPIRSDQSRVIKLSHALEEAIEAVKHMRAPQWDLGPQHYVVKQAFGRKNPVYRVSSQIAKTVEACDGKRTICRLVEHLGTEFPIVPESERDYRFLRLIKVAFAKDLILILSCTSDSATTQDANYSIS